jgi:hypothetical protein
VAAATWAGVRSPNGTKVLIGANASKGGGRREGKSDIRQMQRKRRRRRRLPKRQSELPDSFSFSLFIVTFISVLI